MLVFWQTPQTAGLRGSVSVCGKPEGTPEVMTFQSRSVGKEDKASFGLALLVS